MNDAKNLDYYRSLPYGITLRKDEEDDWVARVEELPGCTAHGGTQAEALEKLDEVKTAWIEDAIESGDRIPEPKIEEGLPSGKWLQRVPRSLHKGLSEMAQREGVSLNQFVTTVLAEALGARRAAAPPIAENPMERKGWDALMGAWHLHKQEWDNKTWHIDPQKPIKFLIHALDSGMCALPNEVDDIHFRVTEHANKKIFSFKS
jgi:antitoxin HicB